jgi:protoheme IX farnesyltransferase
MKTSDIRKTIKAYYYLTKPGIVRSNTMTGIAGFLLASHGSIRFWDLIWLVVGLTLILASSCVSNNYLDRGIDSKMARTQKRALVTGKISNRNAIIFAAVLGGLATVILAVGNNILTAVLGLLLFVTYVFVYGYAKRKSVHGTLVGTIPGALPPVIGYAAVTGAVDIAASLLFLIMVCWQMPHFYAIAMFRREDYKAAGIPVMSVVKGFAATKVQIIIYVALFAAAAVSLSVFGYASQWYGVAMAIIGSLWLIQTLRALRIREETALVRWSRQIFGYSLLVLLLFSVAVGVDSFLA